MTWKSCRSLGVFVVLVAATGLVAGCGGGGTSSTGTDRADTGAATAQAVNLRTGDVPNAFAGRVWEQGVAVRLERERRVDTPPFDARIERCDGGVTSVDSSQLVGFRSPNFTRGAATASPGQLEGTWSVVYVFASEAAAKHELSVLASMRAQTCLARDGDTSVPGSETHFEVSSLPTVHGSGVVGMSWSAQPSSYHPPTRRYQDLLAFTAGRALIVLHSIGTPHPFHATLEARLLGLLRSRAVGSGTS